MPSRCIPIRSAMRLAIPISEKRAAGRARLRIASFKGVSYSLLEVIGCSLPGIR